MRSTAFKLCALTCFVLLILLSTSGAAIKDFTLEAYFFQKVGVPFELSIKNAVDELGNPASGTVQIVIKAGDGFSPDSFPPILNPIVVSNGAGSAFQVLTNVAPTIFEGLADTVRRVSNTIFVTSGELHHFTLSLPSPQTSGQPFTSPAVLTAKDMYGNAVVNFDAAVDPVVISASDGGLMGNNVFDHTQDFVLGVSDVYQKQTTYVGRGGFITFEALSQSGKSGTSLPVLVRSLRVESISVNPASVNRGETINITVEVFNTADIAGSITDLDLNFSLAPLSYTLTNATLPKDIPANTSFDFIFEAQIPQDYPSGTSQISATLSGLFNSFVIRDSTDFLGELTVRGEVSLEYIPGSLLPKFYLRYPSDVYAKLGLAKTGAASLLLDTASYVYFADTVGHNVKLNLSQQTVIQAGSDTVYPKFAPSGYKLLFVPLEPGKYPVTLVLKGYEDGVNPYFDSLILTDSVEVREFYRLEYVQETFAPDSVLAGSSHSFTFLVNNPSDSSINLLVPLSRFTISRGQGGEQFTLDFKFQADSSVLKLGPGIHPVATESTLVPSNYPWGDFDSQALLVYLPYPDLMVSEYLKGFNPSVTVLPPLNLQALEIEVKASQTASVSPGMELELFRLTLKNRDFNTFHSIILNEFMVGFGEVSAAELLSSFKVEIPTRNWTITHPNVEGDKALIQFPQPMIISPNQEDTVIFSATIKSQPENLTFSITLNQSDFQPRDYFEGQTGVPVPVTSSTGQPLNFVSPPYTIISGSFKGSASVYPNPFNPEKENATIIFASQSESVKLQIFTLTGEKVDEAEIPANSSSFEWDGKNSDGKRVHSGVYLARLKVRNSGDEVKLRIGVVR